MRDERLQTGGSTTTAFNAAADKTQRKRKASAPFSIRFTDEERARLKREAGDKTLAAYIRFKLFGQAESRRRSRRPVRKRHTPSADQKVFAGVLGELGKSRLASNMNQIAKAAHIGALPVTPELEQDLRDACAALQEMRRSLIAALGIKP